VNHPSIITGALRASVRTTEPKRLGFASYELMVGPTMVYSRIQELGGVAGRGVTLPARPYVRPAFEASAGQAHDEMVNYWRKALFGG
jgi:phage gpG-like protein